MSVGKSATPSIPTYNVGVHFVLCHGPIDKITKILVDERTAWTGTSTGGPITINAPDLFGGKLREGGVTGIVDIAMGGPTQTPNAYMTSKLGAIPAFRGVVSAILNQVYVGMNYYLKPWSFLATRVHTRKTGVPQWQDSLAELPESTSGIPLPANLVTLGRTGVNSNLVFDAPHGLVIGSVVKVEGATDPLYNGTFTIQALGFTTVTASYVMSGTPAANATGTIKIYGSVETVSGLINAVHVVRDCLTDSSWGLGHSEGLIHEASFLAAAQTCYNEGLGFGFLWNKDGSVIDFITEVLKHIQGNIYVDRTDGLFHMNLVRKVANPSGLLVLDSTNVREVNDFRRKSLGDLTSEVTVKFLDNVTYKENSVTVSDSSLAQRQATPIAKIIEYSGVATSEVATKLAIRDLSQLAIPLYSCTILCTRDAEVLNPGDAFVLDWPDYTDSTLIMRVVSINLGTATKNAITIEALEDAFSAPTTYYETPPLSNWVSPISDPIAVSLRLLNESPYYIVATTQGDAFAQAVLSTSTYIAVAGSSPTPDSIAASIWSTTGSTYEQNGSMDFCFSGLLSADIDRLTTNITVVSPLDIDLLTINHFIQLDNELMAVTAITGTQLTVVRGVLDTIPVAHSANARMYGWHDWFAGDLVEYVIGETAKVKLTTVTPRGELALAAAPESTLLTVGRMHKPYPPGNLDIATKQWPSLIFVSSGYTDILTLAFEGTNGSTTITDTSTTPKTCTAVGNAQISTAQFHSGSSSCLFDGTGDYIDITDHPDFDLTSDFSIVCWAYWTSSPGTNSALFTLSSPALNMEVYRRPASSHALALFTTSNVIIGGTTITDTTWHKIELKRVGATITLLLDDVSQGTISNSSILNTTAFRIGAYSSDSEYMLGYIDDFTITRAATYQVPLSWAHRNRIQQTAGLIGYYTGSITTEPGVTYSGTLIRTDTLAVLDSFTGETTAAHSFITTYLGEVRAELWSVRAGLDSFQHTFHTFTLVQSTWDGLPSTWDAFTSWS